MTASYTHHKVLFIGDVHIKHKNVSEIEILIKVLSDLRPGSVDFVVVAGDVLDAHEKIETQLLNRAYDFIRILRRIAHVFVLVGNHDYINNQQFLTDNHWMNGMKEWKDVTIVDKPVVHLDEYVLVPYVYPGRFVEALLTLETSFSSSSSVNKRLKSFKDAKCIFAHQEIKGCKMGALVSTIGDEWDPAYPMLISGHIHERQFPQDNVYYPGSVLNHAFGYDSQGLFIFTFSSSSSSSSHSTNDDASRRLATALGAEDARSAATRTESAADGVRDDQPLLFTEEKIDIGLEVKKTIFVDTASVIKDVDLVPSNRFSVKGSMVEISEFKQSLKFKRMKDCNVKIVFRIEEDDRSNDRSNDKSSSSCVVRRGGAHKNRGVFTSVITDLVMKENDVELEKDFKTVFVVA